MSASTRPPEPKQDEMCHGNISVAAINKYRKSIEAFEAKGEKLRGDISADYKNLEEAGANKRAFKMAKTINDMPEDMAKDHLLALVSYLRAFGTFHQLNLFFQQIEVPKVELKTKGEVEKEEAEAAEKVDKSKTFGKGLADAVQKAQAAKAAKAEAAQAGATH